MLDRKNKVFVRRHREISGDQLGRLTVSYSDRNSHSLYVMGYGVVKRGRFLSKEYKPREFNVWHYSTIEGKELNLASFSYDHGNISTVNLPSLEEEELKKFGRVKAQMKSGAIIDGSIVINGKYIDRNSRAEIKFLLIPREPNRVKIIDLRSSWTELADIAIGEYFTLPETNFAFGVEKKGKKLSFNKKRLSDGSISGIRLPEQISLSKIADLMNGERDTWPFISQHVKVELIGGDLFKK